jgi:RNA polymerase sigma-70 factor (ECF subfamily)
VTDDVVASFDAAALSYGPDVSFTEPSVSETRTEKARKKKEAADARRQRADDADRDIFEQVALERSEQAFSELYDRYSPRVYAMMLHYFRVEEDALDILQETMILLWEKAPQLYRENTNVRAAIYHFARNCAIDALRSRKRRKLDVVDLTDDQPRLEDLLADEMTPESTLSAKESRKQVRDALLALSPVQRTAIDLAYFGGLSREEIAQRLGMTKEGVQSMIVRGIKKLRSVLHSQFSAPEEKIFIQASKRELKKELVSIIPYGRD